MSFYGGRGDFYRGQGDPGIFDFLKAAGKTVLGAVTGGPVGAVVGAVSGFGKLTSQRARTEMLAAGPSGTALTPVLRARHAAVVKRGRGIGIMAPGGALPKHLGGGGHRRHMNVANVKALHRATRRLLGFQHLVHRVEKSLMKLARRHHYRPSRVASAPAPRGRHRLAAGDGLGFVGDYYGER